MMQMLGADALVTMMDAYPTAARPDQPPRFRLRLQGRRILPPALTIPANTAWLLTVRNDAAVPARFLCPRSGLERTLVPGAEATIPLGPLQPGAYPFEAEARGALEAVLVATPA